MEDSDFVTQFYNLEGDLISERKKNFFKLLKAQPVSLNEEDLKGLCPRTYLEKLFQIDIFIYFNLYSKVLDVIKEGNAVFISKILKHPLILKSAIGDISAEQFVNDFLPSTSYALRVKILKKISLFLNDLQMDEIIFWVHKRYGFNIAIKILHTCSSNRIKEFLCNYEVKLKPRQIKFIFDKDPELLVVYLTHYKSLMGSVFNHKNLCTYIAQKDFDFWSKLQREQLISSVNLGRRTTKNFIHHNKSDFLNNIQHYSSFLKLDVIVRNLQGNFKEVYFNLFPKDISNLYRNNFSFQLLRFYPKKQQWNVFEQTFMRVFQMNILDNLIRLDSSFVDIFPNKDITNQWADIHYENDKSKPNSILKYCDPNKAIPLFKDKINVTSDIYDRTTLVKLLVENCSINNDLASLESVLKYIWIRHRNEDTIFQMLQQVVKWFKLEQLNENHWNYINEIIGILRLKERLLNDANIFVLKHIEFLCLRGQSFTKEVITFLRDIHSGYFQFEIKLNNPDVNKQILIEIINIYTGPNEFGDTFKIPLLIHNILDFNKDHSEHMISLSSYPSVSAYIESLFNKEGAKREEGGILKKVIDLNLQFPENPILAVKESHILKLFQEDNEKGNVRLHFDALIIKMITKHDRSKFENDVLQLFWDSLWRNSNIRKKVIPWLLNKEPRAILPHIDKIFSLDRNSVNLANVKLMSHLDLDKKIIDCCANKLKYVDDFLKKTLEIQSVSGDSSDVGNIKKKRKKPTPYFAIRMIKPLSILLPTQEYIEMVEKRFIPVKEKMETADPLYKIYSLQCEVAKCFRTTQEPIKVLPTLMKFCVGDYLHSARPSLYSVCYRTPETVLYPYIDLLSKRAVSVRKHALFLSCELLDLNRVISILERTNETNVSGQKHVFSAILKYFCKNPCQELLDIVGQNINKIDKTDTETLNNLIKIKVPKKYTEFYVQKCWYFIESRGQDIDSQKYLESFLNSIISSEDIISSSPDWCKHIITNYFKQSTGEEKGLYNIYSFVCMVLRQHQHSEAICNLIFNNVSEYKKNKNIKPIKQLFNEFYSIALKDIKLNNKIDAENNYYIELFKQHWFTTFTFVEMFDEHFLLNLLYIRCKSYDKMENYARDVVVYLEEVVAEYGPYIYNKLKQLMLQHSCAVEHKHLFCYNVLKFKNSTLNCVLILELLETCGYYDRCNDECDCYRKIIEIVKTSNEPIVSAYLNTYIKNNSNWIFLQRPKMCN